MKGEPAPTSVVNGLAVYATRSHGPPVLLVPSPHGFVTGPAAASALHGALVDLGVRVLTFDPPGAYASSRPARQDLEEMTGCCREALVELDIPGPVPVVAHSHASLCALHLALERPELVGRLLLVGAVAGGAAVTRADRGLPFSLSRRDPLFWRIAWDGTRLVVRGDLGVHKRLVNLVQSLSFADPTRAPQLLVQPVDRTVPAPVRDHWQRRVRRVDLRPRLAAVTAPTLVCVGRHDPQTPLPANVAIAAAIPGAELVVFENSGHYPFTEEPHRFRDVAAPFLRAGGWTRHHSA
jgi:proline iminopeptidase